MQSARRSLRSLLERFIHCWPRDLEGGNETEKQRAPNREHESKHTHGRVHFDLAQVRQSLRTRRAKQIDAPPRQKQAGATAEQRKEKALAEQLADNERTTRTERCPDRDLAAARSGARQEKVRHVRARNQQDQGNRAQQN